MFTRKSIIKQTSVVSWATLVSKLFGLVREFLNVRYLGGSDLADAFITAWKIPNSLRKIFAEGALSSAFVPSLVQAVRKGGPLSINRLMLLAIIIFQLLVLLVCLFAWFFLPPLVNLGIFAFNALFGWGYSPVNSFMEIIAPGFSAEQFAQSTIFLYILMPFIFLTSVSALIAGALQAVHHFLIPALGSVILNIFYIAGLVVGIWYDLSPIVLCWFVIVGSIVQCVSHVWMYWSLGFRFTLFTWQEVKDFKTILYKFFWCTLGSSVEVVGVFLDTSFASMLPKGSISLIYYANRFMGIPLGVFAAAFSTTLLTYFSRIGSYAPQRLGFYLLHATKLVWWVTFPVTIVMILLSQNVFLTVFLSDKFTVAQAHEAGMILSAFVIGLFFFAINKVLLNVYYALHETRIPGFVAAVSLLTNVGLNWILMDSLQATGLALATTLSGILQTILLFAILKFRYGLSMYGYHFLGFVKDYAIHLCVIGAPFILIYNVLWMAMSLCGGSFFIASFGYWVWVTPLCALFMYALYITRYKFNTQLLFLEH